MVAKPRKTWREKLADSKGSPKVVPIEVDAIIKTIPKGKLITIHQIREQLARKHKATIGCPITRPASSLGSSPTRRRKRWRRAENE